MSAMYLNDTKYSVIGEFSSDITPLNVTANGTYTAEAGAGFSPVSVNVPTGSGEGGSGGSGGSSSSNPYSVSALNVTKNGTYEAPEGSGFSPVTVQVPGAPKQKSLLSATAATAMSKGDTVYFENQIGEWSDISSEAGFLGNVDNTYANIAISSDGRYVYITSGNSSTSSILVYDTSTSPWTRNTVTGVKGKYIVRDGNTGVIFDEYNTISLIDLSKGNNGAVIETITETNANARIYPPRTNAYIMEDYIIAGGYVYDRRTNTKIDNGSHLYITSTRSFYITSGELREYVSGEQVHASGLNSFYPTSFAVCGNKIFVTNNSGQMCCIEDIDTYPWTIVNITLPTAFVPYILASDISADGSKILVPDFNNDVLGIMDTDSYTWNVIGYFSSSISNGTHCVIGGNLAIIRNVVFRNTGSGTVAHRAYNNLHSSRALGYALKDMTAGEKGSFGLIFS